MQPVRQASPDDSRPAIEPEVPLLGTLPSAAAANCESVDKQTVGELLRYRARYLGRFIYWTARHRSFARAKWVMDFEGITWK